MSFVAFLFSYICLSSTLMTVDSPHTPLRIARRLRHDDYTVAWICALPIELAVRHCPKGCVQDLDPNMIVS